jgi:hypothetical protein
MSSLEELYLTWYEEWVSILIEAEISPEVFPLDWYFRIRKGEF